MEEESRAGKGAGENPETWKERSKDWRREAEGKGQVLETSERMGTEGCWARGRGTIKYKPREGCRPSTQHKAQSQTGAQ